MVQEIWNWARAFLFFNHQKGIYLHRVNIAWRSQHDGPDSTLWTPCDDVAVAFEDGALVVTSFRAGPDPLRLEDAAEPTGDGRFRLLGRLDRTVKLEEKRISLPELERSLEALPWVARAAVVLLQTSKPLPGAAAGLPQTSNPLPGAAAGLPQTSRPMLGAVVVLRPDAPGSAGAPAERAARVRALRAHLAQRFEAPALPRRWRFPQAWRSARCPSGHSIAPPPSRSAAITSI